MTTLGQDFLTSTELHRMPFRHVGNDVLVSRTARLCFVENISIGDNSRIDDFTVIVASREPVNIGRYCHIASQVYVAAREGFEMGDFCALSPGTKLWTGSDDYTSGKLTNSTVPREYCGGNSGRVVMGEHTIIGSNCVILPDVEFGFGCAVGAMSLIRASSRFPKGSILVGVPARPIGSRPLEPLRDAAAHLLRERGQD